MILSASLCFKEIYNHDLLFLRSEYSNRNKSNKLYALESFWVITGNLHPTAKVQLRKGSSVHTGNATGDSTIDTLYSVIRELTGINIALKQYKSAVSPTNKKLSNVLNKRGCT
ncbi:alpha-isopropylmalate synthase regulatory domain-containing protein [Paenibacillus bovis]|nr:alpha-isopropylmalate synthase regulatory domain-containing protein [Paenibacillus bovis]